MDRVRAELSLTDGEDVEIAAFVRKVVQAAVRPGVHVVVWGVSAATLAVLERLCGLGLEHTVVAVVDHRPSSVGAKICGFDVAGAEAVADRQIDVLVIGLNAEKEDALRAFLAHSDGKPDVLAYGRAHFAFRDEEFWELVGTNYVRSLTGGYRHVLVHVYQCLQHLVRREAVGDVVEFGVYRAGTAIFMARCLARWGHEATVFGFDTFAGFPAKRSVLDSYAEASDEYVDEAVVRANSALHPNIELISGDIAETFTVLAGRRLMFTLFDTDNYSATRKALPLCADQTVPGGMIVFDHFYSPQWPAPIGERMAAQEVLLERGWLNLHATGVFLKV